MQKPRILIINDNESIRELLRINLFLRNYDAAAIPGKTNVFDLVNEFKPDIVIIDLMLNLIDGFELCRLICSETDFSVIGLNTRGNDSDKLDCLEIGVSDYLVLPIGIDEILARIKAVLRSRRFLREKSDYRYREWSAI